MDADQLVRKVTALTGFTHAAGVEVLSAEPGRVSLSLAKKPELLQFNGYFHGGVVSGLADQAAGAAASTALAAGKIAVTVDLHVVFRASQWRNPRGKRSRASSRQHDLRGCGGA